MEGSNTLEIINLECSRGNRRLFSELNFSLNSGMLLYVQGPNGSGKTTLLRSVCGLLQPSEGVILWNGVNIHNAWEDFCRNMLYLGHVDGVKPELTGIENLKIAMTLAGSCIKDASFWDVFSQIGLAGLEDLPCRVLSQGQRRRVALARLLLSQAPLWVLDEPFVGLDVNAVALLLRVIKHHADNGGLVVFTTHQEVSLSTNNILNLQPGPKSAHV